MKKFTRIGALIALTLVLAGSIVLGVGIALGGKTIITDAFHIISEDSEIRSMKDLLRNVSINHHKNSLSFDVSWDDDEFNGVTVDGASYEHDDKLAYTIQSPSLDILEIDIPNGTIQIEEGAITDSVQLEITSKHHTKYFQIKDSKNGKVKIGCTKNHWDFSDDVQISIIIPSNYKIEHLAIENAAGNLLLSGNYSVNNFDLDLAAGDVVIKDVSFKTAELEVAAGNTSLHNTRILEELDIECAAGNTELTLPGSESDYNYDLECGLGQLKLDGSSFSGFSNTYKHNNHSDIEINIECACGNIEVHFQ